MRDSYSIPIVILSEAKNLIPLNDSAACTRMRCFTSFSMTPRLLLQLALRLANTLNHLAPVFAEPSRP
jgi:hypothetical protein